MADRMGARQVLAFGMGLLCVSLIDLFAVGTSAFGLIATMLFIVGYGSPTGTTSTTIPMLLGECLGMRRFGTLMGIIGFIATVASALGPLVAALIALMVHPAPGNDQVPAVDRTQPATVALQTPGG
jgi:MFS family permease